MDLAYTSYVDTRRVGPSLIVQVQNPRILLLFRFVSDVMQAMEIVTSAATRTKDEAKQSAQAVATAGAPVMAAALQQSAQQAAAAPAAPGAKPLELVLQLRNVGLLVPTVSGSRRVLGGSLEHLMLAMPGEQGDWALTSVVLGLSAPALTPRLVCAPNPPGTVLPEAMLRDCRLPCMDDMARESVLSTETFKYCGFHDAEGSPASVPRAASAPPAAPSDAEVERERAEAAAAERRHRNPAARLGAAVRDAVMEEAEGGALPMARARHDGRPPQPRRRPPGVLYLDDRPIEVGGLVRSGWVGRKEGQQALV